MKYLKTYEELDMIEKEDIIMKHFLDMFEFLRDGDIIVNYYGNFDVYITTELDPEEDQDLTKIYSEEIVEKLDELGIEPNNDTNIIECIINICFTLDDENGLAWKWIFEGGKLNLL